MNSKEKYEKLRNEGINVYSISRLNTYNTCPYAYHLTYNEKDRGENNAYGIAGTEVHDWLEDIHNDVLSEDKLPELFDSLMIQLELEGATFPSKKIGDNWEKDMRHFINTFERIKGIEIETEKHILYEIVPNVWLQGYIDVIGSYNGENMILDWKTSSLFRGQGLVEAGRQLLLYKDAIEKTTDKTIDHICWYMIKYIDLEFNGRTATLSRRDWVQKSKSKIERAFGDGADPLIVSGYVDLAIQENSIDSLPQNVKNQFKIKPHVKEYDFTDEMMEEAKNYVIDTVSKIENEKDWQPCNVSKNNFFCQNLCNHRAKCHYLKEYLSK